MFPISCLICLVPLSKYGMPISIHLKNLFTFDNITVVKIMLIANQPVLNVQVEKNNGFRLQE